MKLYIAGASKEPERVRAMMDAAKALGFELTLDWLAVIEAHQGRANEGLTETERMTVALFERNAVERADVFWLLAPENTSAGCWVEFGMAVRKRSWCIVASGSTQRSIFAALADAEFATDKEALAYLARLLA